MSTVDMPAQPAVQPATQHSKALRLGINVIIISLWLWLYRPVFDYLAIIFSREDFRTNQIVLISVIGLIIARAGKHQLRPRLDAPLYLFRPGLILALGASTLYLIIERFLDINTLSASLFGLASYGLLGLWIRQREWRQGLPAILLLIGTLPFGEHMQTFIGYPVRILTAALVRDGLAAAGIGSVGIDTILVFENGVSQVDLPCSGVKSLWTGMLFLIAATWVERRPLNLRWVFIAIVFSGLLLIANLARVGILVAVGQVANLQLMAEMLHIPLGVLGFIGACAAAVFLLRWQPPHESPPVSQSIVSKQPRWLAPVLMLSLLLMILFYSPRPQTGLAGASPTWRFPDELITEPMPLKPDELEWLTREGAESADRHRFDWYGISGSMIFITSNTWRAHHRPERCFEVYGLSVDDSRTHLVSPDFPLRLVMLGDGNGRSRLSAAYWFQSVDVVTDDYANRMWADLPPHRQRWILVSILFDGIQDPTSPDIQAFYNALHDAVSNNLLLDEKVTADGRRSIHLVTQRPKVARPLTLSSSTKEKHSYE